MPDALFVVPIIGGALIVLGLGVGLVQRAHRKTWVKVSGRVVSHTPDANDLSLPVVEYTTLGGEVVRATQQGGVDIGIYTTGQAVPVWYDPRNPHRFTANVRGSHLVWLLLCGLGALVIVIWSFLL